MHGLRCPWLVLRQTRRLCFCRSYSQESDPLRVCVIGSGPAGFYTAHQLVKVSLSRVKTFLGGPKGVGGGGGLIRTLHILVQIAQCSCLWCTVTILNSKSASLRLTFLRMGNVYSLVTCLFRFYSRHLLRHVNQNALKHLYRHGREN